MSEILENLGTNFILDGFFHNLMMGEITLLTGLLFLMIAAIISVIGGAIGGMFLAGKDLGYELAAMIGGLFGPAGVIPMAMIGLVLLKLV